MQRLRRGPQQPLSASTWNAFVDSADAFKRAKELGAPSRDISGNDRPDRVTIENLTSADLRRGEVVELGSFLLNDRRPENPWFEGLQVDLTANRHTFGVMLLPTPDNKFGKCLIVGACIAKVYVHDEGHQYAELVHETPILASAPSGPARILDKPEGMTGEQDCWVLLGDDGPMNFIGKATAAIAKGASGVCAIWAGTPGSEVDTGLTVTAYNRVSDVASGDWVSITRMLRFWYLAPLECPAT